MNYAERVIVDPDTRFGKPIIKGTRMAVADILEMLAAGNSEGEILAEFPQLAVDDIRACLAYAADRERYTRVAG